jgi:hypothetical protein
MEVNGQLHILYTLCLVKEKSPWNPLDMRLGGTKSQSGCLGKEEKSQLLLGIKPWLSSP